MRSVVSFSIESFFAVTLSVSDLTKQVEVIYECKRGMYIKKALPK